MFPITSIAQVVALEQRALQSGAVTQMQMMDRAGQALYRQVLDYSVAKGVAHGPVVVLAGPGNNGGDGLVAARYLHDGGERVSIYLWNRPVTDDVLVTALHKRKVPIVRAQDDPDQSVLRCWLRLAAWCVDALLGTGSNRPIAEPLARILDAVRSLRRDLLHVCAADCPSGLNCDTGAVDPHTLAADLTVMFGAAKRGVYHPRAFPVCGLMKVEEIGLPQSQVAAMPVQGLQPQDLPALLPTRVDWGHKGTFGKTLCIGGSQRYPGAMVFSALAAARAGTGLVTAAIPSCIQAGLIPAMPDVTFLPLPHREGTLSPDSLDPLCNEWSAYDAVLLGCGLACTPDTIAFVDKFLEAYRDMRDVPLVLDADALNCLARLEDWPARLPSHTVLTPHVAEMGRLCGQDAVPMMEAEWDGITARAATWNCTVLLKGYRSLIGTREGKLYVLHQPNSALSTAGTGDVLSGLVTGLLAQDPAPARAAQAAALIHSQAGWGCAASLGAASTLASDVLARIPHAIRKAYAHKASDAGSNVKRRQDGKHD